ncbi:MAG: AMP-binding protein [Gammaproteobacteria bacterium]
MSTSEPLSNSYFPAVDDVPLLETTCGNILRHAAAETPDAVALIDADGPPAERSRWTYRELAEESERLACALARRFEYGSHIAIWSENSPQWVIAQFALAMSGMVLVTINPALKAAELAYVLRQSRAQAIFHQQVYRDVLLDDVIAQACETEALNLKLVLPLDQLSEFIASNPPGELPDDIRSDAPVMIQYTSGTTGQPKGALLSHYGITNNARIMAILKNQNEQTINLAVAPLFHTAGCVANVLGTIQSGGTLLLPSSFSANTMLDLIEQEKVTYTFAVPTMLIALLNEQAQRPRDLSSLEIVFSGAATVPVEIVKRVEAEFGVQLIIGYGQTETSPSITHTRLDDSALDKSETIGYAIPHVEIKIVDPETQQIQPIDTPGELCTRGFHVMMGYFENQTATDATIDADGWLRTGDLCSMDARGYCKITGRLKDLIIRGGENIYPREIEEILYEHEDVEEVAVIGLPDDYWGEEVAAVVRTTAGSDLRGETLANFLADKLAKHKVPKHWFALAEIPATASGKLQKFKLVKMAKNLELEALRI